MASKRQRQDAEVDGDLNTSAIEMVKRKRFFSVPKDQQKILDRGGNSYHTIKQGLNGLRTNIPSGVLDNLLAQCRSNQCSEQKASEKSSRPARNPRKAQGLSDNQDGAADESPQSSVSRGQHNPRSRNSQLQSPSPSSSPSRSMTWSPSPVRHRGQPVASHGSEAIEETPAGQHLREDASFSPSKPCLQLDYTNFPSSDGSEDELEVDIPDGQLSSVSHLKTAGLRVRHLASSPLKFASAMQNTPPCGQPPPAIIPGTLDQAKGIAKEGGSQCKRKPRWRAVSFSDDMAPEQHANLRTRMPTTKVFEMTSSNSTDSSVVVPATLEPLRTEPADHEGDPQMRTRRLTGMSPSIQSRVSSNPAGHHQPCVGLDLAKVVEPDPNLETEHVGSRTSPKRPGERDSTLYNDAGGNRDSPAHVNNEFRSQAPLTQDHGPTKARSGVNLIAEYEMQIDMPGQAETALNENVDPYKHFASVYSSYEIVHKGNFQHFLHAAVVLDSLRSQMALKSALYDDFIRAFSDGYVQYVQETGPDRESQPAFEWYNWKDEPILFSRGVLNQRNLDTVRAAYPVEYSRVQDIINGDRGSPEPLPKTREDEAAGQPDQMAGIGLREPERLQKHKTNSHYLVTKTQGLKSTVDDGQHLRPSNDQYTGAEAFPIAAGRSLTNLETASHDVVCTQLAAMIKRQEPMIQNKPGQGNDQIRLLSPDATTKSGTNDVRGILPAVVTQTSKSRASSPSAGPIPEARVDKGVSSPPMGPPRLTFTVSRESSNAPSSSAMTSVRRTSSSSITGKLRLTGPSYLQRLKVKGENDEARSARMRELGRAKRLSRSGSVASSHAGS